VSPTTTVRVDADGAAVFGTGADSVFALVDGIAADLRAGVNVSSRLDQIDVRMSAIVGEHADVGVRQSRLDRAKESLMEQSTQLEAQRSGIEDIDLGSVILQLQTQNVNYQAALGVTARVLQPSLMDFLR
jgi:flagellar hook-associated protein 3 FlgL